MTLRALSFTCACVVAGCTGAPHRAALQPSSVAITPSKEISLALGGDVMFGRVTADGWRAQGGADPFGQWAMTLKAADVAFVNLEMGVCQQGRTESLTPLLWAPPSSLQALTAAGIDAVSVANNHALDCGEGGLEQTVAALAERGIAAVGVAPQGSVALNHDVTLIAATFEPPRRSGGGVPVVLQPTPGHPRPLDDFVTRVSEERALHPESLLVVSLHWGQERVSKPAAWQATFARRLVHAGANVIAGHGSHTRQPREDYAGAVILYGLGNFVFDDRTQVGRSQPPVVLHMRREAGGWHVSSGSRQ